MSATDAAPEPVMISALEHYSYCPRQCALIHLDQSWDDNSHTVRGTARHERVDREEAEQRPDIRREWAVPLWSERLELVGRADLVEFRPSGPYPVEYKSGKRRQWAHEAIQLGAQALCLEEMTGQPVPVGAVFYHGSRARREIDIDQDLRELVSRTVAQVRALLADEVLPPPIHDARCRQCSLQDICMPDISRNRTRARAVLDRLFALDEPDAERPCEGSEE
jgi:CRISPR-associated exonuclease Cas4